ARSSPGSGCRRTAVSSSPEMPTSQTLSVRGTPVQMLRHGSGPPLLFLHGAGGAGRWLAFQERLAKDFSVYFPSHPGHGGSPAAAVALAPPDQSIGTLALQYRQGTALARVSWNPYLYNPLLRRRLGRIGAPTLLCWGAHDRLAPLAPCGETWAREILGSRLRV